MILKVLAPIGFSALLGKSVATRQVRGPCVRRRPVLIIIMR